MADLAQREAETEAEWRLEGRDRRRWPWAPFGLLAIWLVHRGWTFQGWLHAFAESFDRGPWDALYRFARHVWPLCPFCGDPILTTLERHRCQ